MRTTYSVAWFVLRYAPHQEWHPKRSRLEHPPPPSRRGQPHRDSRATAFHVSRRYTFESKRRCLCCSAHHDRNEHERLDDVREDQRRVRKAVPDVVLEKERELEHALLDGQE